MVEDAQIFANSHNLAEYSDLFGRAALVAREGKHFDTIGMLTPEERTALEYERDHKWHGPWMLWYSIALCAIGAATQGTSYFSSAHLAWLIQNRLGSNRL